MATRKPQSQTKGASADTPTMALPVFYNDQYVVCAEDFDTTRKANDIYDSLKKNPITGLRMFSPYKLRSLIWQ